MKLLSTNKESPIKSSFHRSRLAEENAMALGNGITGGSLYFLQILPQPHSFQLKVKPKPGNRKLVSNGHRASIWEEEKCYGDTTLWLYATEFILSWLLTTPPPPPPQLMAWGLTGHKFWLGQQSSCLMCSPASSSCLNWCWRSRDQFSPPHPGFGVQDCGQNDVVGVSNHWILLWSLLQPSRLGQHWLVLSEHLKKYQSENYWWTSGLGFSYLSRDLLRVQISREND